MEEYSFEEWKNRFKSRTIKEKPVGRFAPSPTGFMHLGNVWAALIAWLSVKQQDGTMILRVEDLDPDRSKPEFVDRVKSDMLWLGLDWDEGPDYGGDYGPYTQGERRDIYESALNKFRKEGLVYPCFCTRKELRASSAPHREDGVILYGGQCGRLSEFERSQRLGSERHSWRIRVPNQDVSFNDLNYGLVKQNISRDCGDFVLARTDGIHAYQLAVVVDDALMGVDLVVRGADLLDSTPRQIFLHEKLGYEPPTFGHVPLLLGENADRLSKRHKAMDLGELRMIGWKPEDVIGLLGYKAGLIDKIEPLKAIELKTIFNWSKLPKKDITLFDDELKR